jgi:hypothetical protein
MAVHVKAITEIGYSTHENALFQPVGFFGAIITTFIHLDCGAEGAAAAPTSFDGDIDGT